MPVRKWIAAVLCLALLLGVMPEVRAAQVSGDFEYSVDANGNATVTRCRNSSVTELTVPDTIAGHPVTVIAQEALRGCTAMRSLVLPESLRDLQDNLLYCRNLERIYVYSRETDLWGVLTNARIYIHQGKVPMTLVSSNNYCPFEEIGCDPRTETICTEGCMRYILTDGEAVLLEAQPEGDFTVPDTLGGCPVTRIAPCCFLGATKLRRLTLPDSVRMIGRGALQPEYVGAPDNPIRLTALPASLEYVGDSALTQIDLSYVTELPSGISHVGVGGFESCRLKTLTIPGTLKIIRTQAFANNPLKEIVMCEGVEELRSNGFNISSGRITIPHSVTGVNEFWSYGEVYGKPSGLDIFCDSEGPVGAFLLERGIGFYDIDTGEYFAEPYMVQLDGVKYRILPRRYAEVIDLELGAPADLVIPETVEGLPVKWIRDWALCSDVLRSVVLPDTVRRIAEDAMIDCPNLERVRLSENLESLADDCFGNCTKLKVLRIPASVTEIRGDYLGYNRVLMGEPGSYAEEYARLHHDAFVAEQPGTAYVIEGPAVCRVEEEGAVLVGLAPTWGSLLGYANGYYYEVPDTAGGLPIVGIDGGVVFSRNAEDLFLGSYVRWIGSGALDGTEIWRLYTYPTLSDLPEDLFDRVTLYNDRIPELQGFGGSYAQAYAAEHGFSFVEVDGTPFVDVPRDSWFFEPVFQCYWSGLMNGTSPTTFSPHSTASRAMLVTVLWRLLGCESPQYSYFSDVSPESWYYKPVNWAAEHGVVFGTGPYRFSPDQNVTREQTAAILFRLASAMGLPADSFAPLGGFRDADSASDYARSALMWAVDAGILQGNDRHELRPQGTATRAELAAMLIRFVAWYEKEMAA